MSLRLMSKPLRAVHRAALSLLSGALLALGLAACGSSSGPSGSTMGPQGCTATTCGSALLTLTDANGDFTSYTVDVSSLQLTKADGAVVETLPVKTRIDFAQLVNVTEFLTAATVPNGDYVAATMTVDYSHAAVYVEVNGSSQLATLVDGSGAPLATLQLTVQLDNAHHLVVAPGHPARLALDFNLAASNTVDLSHSPPLVTVKPFIVASLVPADAHELRVRGTLISVDTSGSYTVNVEPFEDSGANHGSVVVHTTPQTTFEIDGTAYTGAPGLAALATLPTGAWTVAFGALDESTETFTASRVLAGSSVEHPGLAAPFFLPRML